MVQFIERNWHSLLWSGIWLAVAIVLSLIARLIVFWLLARMTKRRGTVVGNSLVRHGKGPTRWIFPLLAALCVLPGLPLPRQLMLALEHITGIGLIAAIAWMVILFVEVVSDILTGRYRVDVADNLAARRVRTQFQMVQRLAVILVAVVAVSIALMTFPAIKHIGVSILASAGLASLVMGMAMKGTLSNLVAGVQLAFTQPFRLDDVVIVDGEWGRIEEITTTYVVVAIWDQRRLIVPLSYFTENSFQNWTRRSAELLGYPYLYVDYGVPVEALRQEFQRVLESTPMWDKRVNVLQVTDLSSSMMQIRCLFSVRNSSDQWNLSCLVREKMIEFIRVNYPDAFPRTRFSAVAEFPAQTNAEAGPFALPGSEGGPGRQQEPQRKSA